VSHYSAAFWELIRTPFQHIDLIWGIVPLYVALLMSELTSSKANYRTAVQTGFSFIWAAAQWLYPYFQHGSTGLRRVPSASHSAVSLFVTVLVLAIGVVALVSGLRRRFPKRAKFLGHTRFGNYFMIAIYPIQTHYLMWSWTRLAAIVLFALPSWLILHFGLMPLRNRS